MTGVQTCALPISEGPDSPNKKYYDPRVWLRKGEESLIARLELAFKELNAVDVL